MHISEGGSLFVLLSSAARSIRERMNLPNRITVTRLAIVLLFTVVLAVGNVPNTAAVEAAEPGAWFSPLSVSACVALWAFVIGAISDFLDGHLARKYGLVTNLGKLLDPLADKILVCAAFVYLSSVGMCPFWVTILVLFREFLVTGLRQLAALRGEALAADRSGKWKTGLQLGFCIACLFHLAYGGNAPQPLRWLSVGIGGEWCRAFFLWGSVLLTVGSGLHYAFRGRHLLR